MAIFIISFDMLSSVPVSVLPIILAVIGARAAETPLARHSRYHEECAGPVFMGMMGDTHFWDSSARSFHARREAHGLSRHFRRHARRYFYSQLPHSYRRPD